MAILSAGQGVADPGDDAVPLTFFGRRVVDQHTVDEAPCKVAAVVPDFSFAEDGHDEETWCHPLIHNIPRWIFPCQNTAGENPASFGTDWTVKSARRSDVRKRPRILLPAFQPVRKRWTLECQPRHHFRGLDTCSN